MQITTTAIVLKSTDYGDKDKILYLYSLEKGLMSVKLKGVRQPSSKLKIFSLPFCLAEWELVSNSKGNNEFYTVKGANLIEVFYDLSTDIDKYYVACIMLDSMRNLTYYRDEVNTELFVVLLKSLKTINYSNIQPKLVLTKFLLEILRINGYSFQVRNCATCGIKLQERAYLAIDDGSVKCATCREGNSIELGQGMLACIRNINEKTIEQLENIKVNIDLLDSTILIVKKNVELRLQINLNFNQIV